jgi:predicted alpha/beta superfamily hydrolase
MDRRRFTSLTSAALGTALLGVRAGAQAQAQGVDNTAKGDANPPRKFVIENSQIIPLDSKHTGKRHELIVMLPASHAANPDKTYPVHYYLDAYWDTPILSSIYNNLIYDNKIPECILVGLSYPAGTNYDLERRKDYSPTSTGPGTGGGEAFLAFITQEAAPLVESRFRGRKTDRVISGNSMGGLFAIAAAYMAPDFFAGHIAVSPAASWDNNVLAKMDAAWSKSHRALNARMFVSYGSIEYAPFRDPIVAFQKQLAARHYAGLGLRNYRIADLDHTGVKGEGYTRGLMWVWEPKRPPGPSGLEKGMRQAG